MAGYASEEALRQNVEQLVAEKFGPFRASIDAEKVMPFIAASCDVSQVLQTEDLLRELAAAETSAQLEALNRRVEGLRTIHEVATSSDAEQALAELVQSALLNDTERLRVTEIVAAYRKALEAVHGEIAPPDVSEQAVLGSITPEAVQAYVGRLYEAGEWLNPTTALVSIEQLTELSQNQAPNAEIFQSWSKLFFDEKHYAQVICRFEEIQRPFLADVARLFLYQARVVNGALADRNFVTRNASDIAAMLDRVDANSHGDFTGLGPIGGMVPSIAGSLRLVLGSAPALRSEERSHHLEMAERQFDGSPVPMFRTWAPMIRWMRAQMAQPFEREQLELSALSHVNVLLAQCALEKDTVTRLYSMAVLMALPAAWKLEKGDFAGSIESATTAKAMAQAAVNALAQDAGPLLEEMRKRLEDEDSDSAERAQLTGIRSALLSVVENSKAIELGMELLNLQALAKLAETRSRFADAYAYYQQASQVQHGILESTRKLILTFIDSPAFEAAQFSASLQHEARAIYFQGMASLNKGDLSLMNLDFREANICYQDAGSSFSQAAEVWKREAARLPEHQSQQRSKANQEESGCQDRIRYCDARLEMAEAERLSSLDQYWEAAKHFEKAAGIFGELVLASRAAQGARTAAIFKASQEICSARFLMNVSRRNRLDTTAAEEVAELLDKASARFDQNGEAQWGSFARALRYEYEAFVYYELARSGGRSTAPALEQDAKRKVADAAAILRQFGMESRATSLETWSRATADRASHVFTAVMLPKPVDASGSPSSGLNISEQFPAAPDPSAEAERNAETSARKLLARSLVLDGRLADLKDRRDRGRIDDGQYTDLAKDLERERIENLLDLQQQLKGRSQAIDEILFMAINNSNAAAVAQKLAESARSKRVPQPTVEMIQRGEGSVVQWIVEVSFTRDESVAAA